MIEAPTTAPAAALDLELLRSFHAIAQLGSLAAAASQRHKTVSAVSMQVKRLEDALGSRLLERGPRGMTLTPTGEPCCMNPASC